MMNRKFIIIILVITLIIFTINVISNTIKKVYFYSKLRNIDYVFIDEISNNIKELKVYDTKKKEKVKIVGNILTVLEYDKENIIYTEKKGNNMLLLVKYNLKTNMRKEKIIAEDIGVYIQKKGKNIYYQIYERETDRVDIYIYNINTQEKEKIIENVTDGETPLILEKKVFFSRNNEIYEYDLNMKAEKKLDIKGIYPFDLKNNELYYISEDEETIKIKNLKNGNVISRYLLLGGIFEIRRIYGTPKKIYDDLYVFLDVNVGNPKNMFDVKMYIYDMKYDYKIKNNEIYKKRQKWSNILLDSAYLFY